MHHELLRLANFSTRGAYHDFIDFCPVTSPAYHVTRLPSFLDRFDWVLLDVHLERKGSGLYNHRRSRDPRTVFARPEVLEDLLAKASETFGRDRRDRVLVLAASDKPLSRTLGRDIASRLATAHHIRTFFDTIYYEAKDIPIDSVKVMPIGLSQFYLSRGVAKNASLAMSLASVKRKPKIALGAWNFYYKLSNPSRIEAEHYVRSTVARQAGVEFHLYDARDWWGQLSKYRFLLIPMGSRLQCFKMIEALLVLTIPIVQRSWYKWEVDRLWTDGLIIPRAQSGTYPGGLSPEEGGVFQVFDDLVDLGFPIVIVDSWSEITSTSLGRWWRQLSPRLVTFRRNCLTADAYWRIVTGQLSRCS